MSNIIKALCLLFATGLMGGVFATILFIISVEYHAWKRKRVSYKNTLKFISDNDKSIEEANQKLNSIKP